MSFKPLPRTLRKRRKPGKLGGRILQKDCRQLHLLMVHTVLVVLMHTQANKPPPVLLNVSKRNVNSMFFLKRGSFVIVRNEKRTYIGKVLDLYKKAAGNCYGSIKRAGSVEELQFLSVRVYLPLTSVHISWSIYNIFYLSIS